LPLRHQMSFQLTCSHPSSWHLIKISLKYSNRASVNTFPAFINAKFINHYFIIVGIVLCI
jgi:hypothetical protein